jgi:hypothetical protein
MWKLGGLTDNVVEPCVINARRDETSSNLLESDSDSEGINPLHDSK